MDNFRLTASAILALTLSACGQSEGDHAEPAPQAEASAVPTEAAATGDERPADFAQCAICHSVEPGINGIGPSLAGVYQAKAGHVGDFAYSTAMRQSGKTWDDATLNSFLEQPQTSVPGTKMSFAGLKDAEKRAAIIAYLKTL
ncbi:MAG: c-type cytochrome [Pontixanthobacter sp.]